MKLKATIFVGMLLTTVACTEQFDPSQTRNMLEEERTTANRQLATLTEDGKLPGEAKVKEFNAAEVYGQLCVSCHGADGKANTPGAMALNPKPRNFTDKTWQASVDDARIKKVLKEGGMSVGLSATMVSFAGVLDNDKKLDAMVKYIRSFN